MGAPGARSDGVVDTADDADQYDDAATLTVGDTDLFFDSDLDGIAHPMLRSACGYRSWLDVPVDDGDDA